MGNLQQLSQQVKAITQEKSLPPALLIAGDSAVRQQRVLQHVIDHFYPEEKASSPIERLDAENLDERRLRELGENSQALSLFSSERVLLVKNGETLKAPAVHELGEVIAQMPESTKLLIIAHALPSRSALLKLFTGQKLPTLLLPSLKGQELTQWTSAECKRFGLIARDRQLVPAIIEMAHESPDRISRIIEQLALFVDESPAGTADLFSLFQSEVSPHEFAVLDTLTQGRRLDSYLLFDELLKSGKNPFAMLALVQRSYSTYIRLGELSSQRLTNKDMQQRIGGNPYALRKQLSALKHLSKETLPQSLAACCKMDATLKNKSLGNTLLFDELSSHLLHAANKRV